ncbi:uncharacterized protein LOC9633257 [Selaginella moellendorffii]|uniref:uncharacterized protein LOC9633257 n=1 Tax=Selaginella moellendorffii TaxID=88036 RepID=UPI000D1C3EDB|nr:uncharacterized protein LOC9633257 [Selaginella moellendorffii]|eukprot:XP_024524554.1 uncharacterized protein LOC9633257 [Selaginella moellendorffii]
MEAKSSGKQVAGRHALANSASRDLFAAARNGTVHDVETALSALKKINGSVDARDRFGSTAMHIATWRNHVPIVKRLLAAGADPNARDGESGWGSLHRALHFGHLAVAGALVDGGASVSLDDSKGRLPVDLVSGPVKQAVTPSCRGVVLKELFSWGNGSNYQLGTGSAGIQRVPCRVETLHGADIVRVSAAKFHSTAVNSSGQLFSWGYGRGGRLGHEDYSGEVAVIAPRQVTGLCGRRVKNVAAAKHHTIVATEGGEVYTWGTNREGQLGYPAVDTQSTPRRVSTLRAKVVEVAAANKHSAAVTESGEVYTWGCNKDGQLGYGTSNSASNCVPRVVDYLKGRKALTISAAKRHTVVIVETEVFTWGHKMVSPRRVVLVRNTKKAGQHPLKFHLSERLHIVAVAAGVVHSTAIAADGLIFSWLSADPQLHAQQVLTMTGHHALSVSAGKYRTAVATSTGDVYAWDSDKSSSPAPLRIHGIKRATLLAVGETHSLAVTEIYVPAYQSDSEPLVPNQTATDDNGDDALVVTPPRDPEDRLPSLRDLCQKVIATTIVEPRNALQILEFADALGADELKRYCESLILRNLDYIFAFFGASFGTTRSSVLADLEKSWDACSLQPWSHRQLPVPSATTPAIVDSEEDVADSFANPRILKDQLFPTPPGAGFLQEDSAGDRATKQLRAMRKKLQQIELLEMKLSKGQSLDDQQMTKLSTKKSILESLRILETQEPETSGEVFPETSSKKQNQLTDERSKRQRRKSKKTNSKKTEVQVPDKVEEVATDFKEDMESKVLGFRLPSPSAEVTSGSDLKTEVSKADDGRSKATVKKAKTKCKKGGLSLFLTGALDKAPETIPPPPPPVPLVAKTDGPAWGGGALMRGKGAASLSEIQTEQKAESSNTSANNKPVTMQRKPPESSPREAAAPGHQRIPLQQFVRSPPAPAMSFTPPKAAPWTGSSSPGAFPSLRDIQKQEAKHKEQRASFRSHQVGSPPVVGFAASSSGRDAAASSSDLSSEHPSCWYKPDTSSPSSIRCIQIEERAMNDLRRLYKNVKMVKPDS